MAITPSPPTPTTRLPRRSTRGVILGLSGARCAALGTAVAIVMVALFSAGFSGLVVTSAVWVPLCASAYARVRGRTVAEWLPVATHYGARRLGGQTVYRAAVSRPRPAGTMALPGDAARLRFHNDTDSGACMIHDPRMGTLVAVAHVTHPAYLLLSPATQRARVTGWGGVIASLAATGSASVIQVLECTLPDPGVGVDGWWRSPRPPGRLMGRPTVRGFAGRHPEWVNRTPNLGECGVGHADGSASYRRPGSRRHGGGGGPARRHGFTGVRTPVR